MKIIIDCPPHVDSAYYERLVLRRMELGLIPEGTTSGIVSGAYAWKVAE